MAPASALATSDVGIILAPNLGSGDVMITYLAPAAQTVKISVVSLLGQTVQVQENQVVAGSNTLRLATCPAEPLR
ncbi:hypothetical protein [Hymenobacter negativus]|uniref:Uncharacterized protein n=1 Tax=Hymenobacter negativus TaxID=2795026 RepID=A0ABS3QJV0_9BACT|nr:hypothetical protein [Hymenobacter negativus]MBO2011536.1 hypothetical protein [Hymenobacter negativus]